MKKTIQQQAQEVQEARNATKAAFMQQVGALAVQDMGTHNTMPKSVLYVRRIICRNILEADENILDWTAKFTSLPEYYADNFSTAHVSKQNERNAHYAAR